VSSLPDRGNMSKIKEKVPQNIIEMLCEFIGVNEKIETTSRFVEDLGFDELDCIEFTMLTEVEYDISIPDEYRIEAKTVGDLITLVQDTLGPIGDTELPEPTQGK